MSPTIKIAVKADDTLWVNRRWLILKNGRKESRAVVPAKPATVLSHLLNANGKVVSNACLRKLHGMCEEADSHAAETTIYRLRKILESHGIHDAVVCEGGGYKLQNVQPVLEEEDA